jgi:L-lactate dehydrogenase complex protein LldG
MTSRDKILQDIKKNNIVKDTTLPEYSNFGITFENKYDKFSTMLKSVGGDALFIKKEELDNTIKELYLDEKIISTNISYCKLGNFDANAQNDPHKLKDIDLAIVKGEFAIAENGAVWIKNEENRHRSLYFIAQNIVIVVEKDSIVHNMHEAYELISFEKDFFGVFVSGPSKTADIEQSLVIGAHGPKSGYVIFVD